MLRLPQVLQAALRSGPSFTVVEVVRLIYITCFTLLESATVLFCCTQRCLLNPLEQPTLQLKTALPDQMGDDGSHHSAAVGQAGVPQEAASEADASIFEGLAPVLDCKVHFRGC
eukprot:6441619-Amphidinium_carterae.1